MSRARPPGPPWERRRAVARVRLDEWQDSDAAARTGPDAPTGTYAPVVDHQGLRAALRRFAERSAENHGCEAPRAA